MDKSYNGNIWFGRERKISVDSTISAVSAESTWPTFIKEFSYMLFLFAL